jgi:hypothetical protein
VRALYKEATSAIKMNGDLGLDFQLARLVKQGCPLAPYLFILATDVLGYMLADPKYEVEGLSLPKGSLIRDQTFADDTTLYLKGTPPHLDKAQRVLTLFSSAFGAKINWHKSAAIWASKNKQTWQWGTEVGLKWIPVGVSIRYLGVQVGSHLPRGELRQNDDGFKKQTHQLESQPVVPGRKDPGSQPGAPGLNMVHGCVLEPQPSDDPAD